jgi:hypothetical protein
MFACQSLVFEIAGKKKKKKKKTITQFDIWTETHGLLVFFLKERKTPKTGLED